MDALFCRKENGDYEVAGYIVEMWGLDALSCDCGAQRCQHMEAAEVAEALYQEKQRKEPPPAPFQKATLNGSGEFSLLR